jgi:mono/diheme cytochrome c family protein
MKDNINLEIYEKKKVLSGFFGLFYIIVLIILITAGWWYLDQLPFFTREQFNPLMADTTKPVADLQVLKSSTTPPVDILKESVSTPDKIAKGKTLFETTCSSCHGAEGKGDGVAGKTLNPPPRNFTELSNWKNGPAFSKIYKTLQEGLPPSAMASFSNIPPEDRIALILYVRTFRTDYPPIDQNELKDLDKTYSLSSGVKQPAQIPVTMAVEKIITENTPVSEKIKSIVDKIQNNKTDKGALILKDISYDLNKSITALINYPKWNENESRFVKFVETSPVQKGFNPDAFNLSSEQWSLLYQYLKTII